MSAGHEANLPVTLQLCGHPSAIGPCRRPRNHTGLHSTAPDQQSSLPACRYLRHDVECILPSGHGGWHEDVDGRWFTADHEPIMVRQVDETSDGCCGLIADPVSKPCHDCPDLKSEFVPSVRDCMCSGGGGLLHTANARCTSGPYVELLRERDALRARVAELEAELDRMKRLYQRMERSRWEAREHVAILSGEGPSAFADAKKKEADRG